MRPGTGRPARLPAVPRRCRERCRQSGRGWRKRGRAGEGSWRRSGSRVGTVGGMHTSTVRETRSEEHTSELQSLMRISYAVFCLKKKKHKIEKLQIRNEEQTQTK